MITVESVLFLALCACHQGQSTVFRTKQKQKSIECVCHADHELFVNSRLMGHQQSKPAARVCNK